ncbi:phosphotriesterase-related protein [soil metagenome]
MIQTVLGPIDGADLGVTSMHDHVLLDASRLQRDADTPPPSGDRVVMENLGFLRWNQLALADNLRLDDAQLAVQELAPAKTAGLRSLLEASTWGMGPNHAGLPDIARRTGLNIVCSYGAYIRRTLPQRIADLSEAELEEDFVSALDENIPGTDFRAAIIGIMGTTGTVTADERFMLRAAARAAARTGAAMTVRLDMWERNGLDVIRLAGDLGLPADRIVFTNADEYLDGSYWEDLSATGAVLEMCFGTEAGQRGRVENPSDPQRIEFFAEFLAAHPQSRHALGQSIWTKAQLRRFGGYGYDHLLVDIVPALRDRGVSAARLDRMLIEEPRRLLDRDAVTR